MRKSVIVLCVIVAAISLLREYAHRSGARAAYASGPDGRLQATRLNPEDAASRSLASHDASTESPPAVGSSWIEQRRELRILAERDPTAALALAVQFSTREEQEAALKDICAQISPAHPTLAMDAAWRFQLGRLGGEAERTTLENLAAQWATVDLNAAIAWVRQQPADEMGQRDRVIKGIASIWSKFAPADAARFVAEHMSSSSLQVEAAATVVGSWARSDFSSASAWVELFPEGAAWDRGLEELVKAAPRSLQASAVPTN